MGWNDLKGQVFLLMEDAKGWWKESMAADLRYPDEQLPGVHVPRGSLLRPVEALSRKEIDEAISVKMSWTEQSEELVLVVLSSQLTWIAELGDSLYQLLRGVKEPETRYQLVLREDLMAFARGIKTGDYVTYVRPDGKGSYPAIVRSQGQSQTGGVGWVLGLEIQDSRWCSQQQFFDVRLTDIFQDLSKALFCDISRVKPCQITCDNSIFRTASRENFLRKMQNISLDGSSETIGNNSYPSSSRDKNRHNGDAQSGGHHHYRNGSNPAAVTKPPRRDSFRGRQQQQARDQGGGGGGGGCHWEAAAARRSRNNNQWDSTQRPQRGRSRDSEGGNSSQDMEKYRRQSLERSGGPRRDARNQHHQKNENRFQWNGERQQARQPGRRGGGGGGGGGGGRADDRRRSEDSRRASASGSLVPKRRSGGGGSTADFLLEGGMSVHASNNNINNSSFSWDPNSSKNYDKEKYVEDSRSWEGVSSLKKRNSPPVVEMIFVDPEATEEEGEGEDGGGDRCWSVPLSEQQNFYDVRQEAAEDSDEACLRARTSPKAEPQEAGGLRALSRASVGSALSRKSDRSSGGAWSDFDQVTSSEEAASLVLAPGSMVQVEKMSQPLYGVVRWRGDLGEQRRDWVGVEMEEEISGGGSGSFKGRHLFDCAPGKGLFLPLTHLRPDRRFHENSGQQAPDFGSMEAPTVTGVRPPYPPVLDVSKVAGRNRGIQGWQNSCYLDATLFSMFAFTSVFDSVLYRPGSPMDIPQYGEVQRVLREEIVNPLRRHLFVRADKVMALRTLLDTLSSVSGLTDQEKDPEEFLNSLFNQVLRAEPYLELSSGQSTHCYQLFVEKDPNIEIPTVQELFDQSFLASKVKLSRAPPALILQMPRFGRQFKMYERVIPTQLLDVTDIISGVPRQCVICGQLAEWECPECYGVHESGLQSTAFCSLCLGRTHNPAHKRSHAQNQLATPPGWRPSKSIPRIYMELVAVVSIETSHYVSFVRCGDTVRSPWAFFDSMADRKGEQNGYNIPEVAAAPEVEDLLSEAGARQLREDPTRPLPPRAKRLVSDAYLCFYQSTDVRMYR